MTPKSLLRHPKCVSTIDEISNGSFMDTIDDKNIIPKNAKRIVLCSGKIYFELIEKRDKLKNSNVAIIRVEQLFPGSVIDVLVSQTVPTVYVVSV